MPRTYNNFVSDAMKAFDRGEKVAGKRKSAYSSDTVTEVPKGDVGYDYTAEKMDKGLPLHNNRRDK